MSRVRPTNLLSGLFLAILLCVSPVSGLHAQEADYTTHIVKWYEDIYMIAQEYGMSAEVLMAYNSLETAKVERRQVLRIPKHPEKVILKGIIPPKGASAAEDIPAQERAEAIPAPVAGEQVQDIRQETSEPSAVDVEEDRDRPHVMPAIPLEDALSHISIALSLPLHTRSGGVNDSNYDFYSGVLLAVRDISENGTSVDLHVTDTYAGLPEAWKINGCNIAVGPLGYADMDSTMRHCTSQQTAFVSPLDSRTAPLALKDERFIQAPSGTDAQNEDAVAWVREDIQAGDVLLVISETGEKVHPIFSVITGSGLPFTRFEYNIVQGRNITPDLSGKMTQTGTNRIIIASDNEAFVNDVIRNLKLVIHAKYPVVLYSTSRIRSFETIDAESLHNVGLHVSTSYYTDYDAPEVKAFLMAYRALYGAEPGPFAFQGYDTVHHFASLIATYGTEWTKVLCESRGHGLQSDFLFKKDCGYMNIATRRLIYESDYSINYIQQD